jgi:PknH-like extracellular domain
MKPAPAVAAAAVLFLAACSSGGNTGAPATTSATTTAPARPTVAAAALDSLLLSPAEIGGAVGAPELPVNKTETQLLDSSAARPDKGCRFTQPAEASVYAGTGWNGVRQQDLQEPGEDFKHHVIQAVVSFPSANDATRFFTASAQLWVPCANHQYRVVSPGKPDLIFVIGPVANTNGTLSTVDTLTGGKKWACQRALTVSNNIAIDVVACSADSPPDAALNIAHQIAAKVDKQ